ncbi:MAG: hypothetical protein NUV82_01250 [Candidatus Komeilibacteria bacterium]|nr:hypothetical protein [Candidatus Komeilibacteria bacterium]
MNKVYTKVILISFIILFLELLLIRLIGTEIRIFAYFSNLLLLGIFIGSGAGMLIKKKIPLSLATILLTIVTLTVIFGWLNNITDLLAPMNESFLWFQNMSGSSAAALLGLLLTLALFFAVTAIFLPLGQKLGELFDDTKKIIAVYSFNVIASLAGMWAFQGLSVYKISIYAGIIAAIVLIFLLTQEKRQRLIMAICCALTVGGIYYSWQTTPHTTVWSPYQKLSIFALPERELQPPGYMLQVNNVGYMGLLDLSNDYKDTLRQKLSRYNVSPTLLKYGDQYELPFVLKPDSSRVLIVGAGGGNDVAAAVRHNVPNIDAVEIDPDIISLGRLYHPEKPYDSTSVKVYNDDGRAFFKQTREKYDLVIMGLADSHTLTSSLTNVRLDHYLYTEEAFQEIKDILTPDGLVFLSFDVRRDWIGQRLQKGLTTTFGQSLLVYNMQDIPYFGWGGIVFIAGPGADEVRNRLASDKKLGDFLTPRVTSFESNINSLTDDWPYLYLDTPRLPRLHLWIAAFLLLIMLLLKTAYPLHGRFAWDFFFLGAGFLLYEFQNISKISLLFGNTWQTNLFTITFILIFILLANLIQAKKPLSLRGAYIGLFITLAMQFFVPLASINALPTLLKVTAGLAFLNLPFLFSGIIFIEKLKRTSAKAAAFASNLIGAAVGGMLEILSFLTGIHSLLTLSIILYAGSLLPLLGTYVPRVRSLWPLGKRPV